MGQSTTVIPTGGGGAKVQDSIPTNPQKGDLWVDTSQDPEVTKWYNGTAFIRVVPQNTVTGTSLIDIPVNSESIQLEQQNNPRSFSVIMDNQDIGNNIIESKDITVTFNVTYSGGGIEYGDILSGPTLHYNDSSTETLSIDPNTRYGPNSDSTTTSGKILERVDIEVEATNDFGLPYTVDLEVTGTANVESNHTHVIQ